MCHVASCNVSSPIPNGCQNGGLCWRPERCNCTRGWIGTYCQLPDCGEHCDTHGTCKGPFDCFCDAGFKGPQCTLGIEVIPSLWETHGVLIMLGTCLFLVCIAMIVGWHVRIRVDKRALRKFRYRTEGEKQAPLSEMYEAQLRQARRAKGEYVSDSDEPTSSSAESFTGESSEEEDEEDQESTPFK
jgi:hypothetical protein